MRAIKFRGKRLDNGEWVYGNLVRTLDAISGWNAIIIPDENANLYSRPNGDLCIEGFYLVDPATVGQYTGLQDRNGQKIYEGDIVSDDISTGEVFWHADRTMFAVDSSQCDIAPMDDWREFRVVGNIHENPELVVADNA